MVDRTDVTNLSFLVAGLGIGAGLALLCAPKSGKETRKYLVRRAEGGRHYVTAMGKELRRKAEDVVGKGRDWATNFVQ